MKWFITILVSLGVFLLPGCGDPGDIYVINPPDIEVPTPDSTPVATRSPDTTPTSTPDPTPTPEDDTPSDQDKYELCHCNPSQCVQLELSVSGFDAHLMHHESDYAGTCL